jgi:hypothetical protein
MVPILIWGSSNGTTYNHDGTFEFHRRGAAMLNSPKRLWRER